MEGGVLIYQNLPSVKHIQRVTYYKRYALSCEKKSFDLVGNGDYI